MVTEKVVEPGVDKEQIESLVATTRQISRKIVSILTRNHRFDNFMDFE